MFDPRLLILETARLDCFFTVEVLMENRKSRDFEVNKIPSVKIKAQL